MEDRTPGRVHEYCHITAFLNILSRVALAKNFQNACRKCLTSCIMDLVKQQ